jgi:predicted adenine nucleotide alpha hydrolase (AANH) superfamily ATPase
MKIMLHICCAPCTLYPLRELARNHEVTGFFFNPNIFPQKEHRRRQKAVEHLQTFLALPVIGADSSTLEWTDFSCRKEKNCDECYRRRLEATVQQALACFCQGFTSTLLFSRFQNHDRIREIGESLGREAAIAFIYEDFRVGWQEGKREAKKMGLYRQNYCGCEASLREKEERLLRAPSA